MYEKEGLVITDSTTTVIVNPTIAGLKIMGLLLIFFYISAQISLISHVCIMKKSQAIGTFLLRSQGSNLGPSGYEPDELPLLYFAI